MHFAHCMHLVSLAGQPVSSLANCNEVGCSEKLANLTRAVVLLYLNNNITFFFLQMTVPVTMTTLSLSRTRRAELASPFFLETSTLPLASQIPGQGIKRL